MGLMRDDLHNRDDLAFPLTLRTYEPMSDEQLIEFSERNKVYKIERNQLGKITAMTPGGGLGGTHEMYVSFKFIGLAEENGNGMAFSPNTGFNLRMVGARMQTWIDNGAKLAWLVDPVDDRVTIYRPGQEAEIRERPESVTATDPIAGFTLPCLRLWPAA